MTRQRQKAIKIVVTAACVDIKRCVCFDPDRRTGPDGFLFKHMDDILERNYYNGKIISSEQTKIYSAAINPICQP